AEDGIRDFHVTGVQTCALPISDLGGLVSGWEAVVKAEDWSTVTLRDPGLSFLLPMRRMQRLKGRPDLIAFAARTGGLRVEAAARSEARRVGQRRRARAPRAAQQ